jgi:hypothetical protein
MFTLANCDARKRLSGDKLRQQKWAMPATWIRNLRWLDFGKV